MTRISHHSSYWGGKRPGSGRKRGNVNRLTKETLEKASIAECHPVDFLLEMVADKSLTMRERGAAAQSLLPYVATRLSSAEIHINGSLSDEPEEQLVSRLLTAQNQLVEMGYSVLEGEAVPR
jgi:hypothetical protein